MKKLACLIGSVIIMLSSSTALLGQGQQIELHRVISRVQSFLTSEFGGYFFNGFISLGNIERFNERARAGDIQVFVSPESLKKIGKLLGKGDLNALYVTWHKDGMSYTNDIVLSHVPEDCPAEILWHECQHAIFHAHERSLLVSDDEQYTAYFDEVYQALSANLPALENERKKPECSQERIQFFWNQFKTRIEEAARANNLDAPKLLRLSRLTGFRVDIEDIFDGYNPAGYFTCPQNYLTFILRDAETNAPIPSGDVRMESINLRPRYQRRLSANSRGVVVFPDMVDADYSVRASAPGYFPESGTLKVQLKQKNQILVRLRKRPENKPAETKGTTTKSSSSSGENILEVYRSLYPAYLRAFYKEATRIDLKYNAAKLGGGKYRCSYIAYGTIKDGPRRGEEYKVAVFERDLTLSQLEATIPAMKEKLRGH